MRSNLTVWLALLALALGSASVAWVRTDTMGNGWMGIQLQSGAEFRIQFLDRDGSGSLSRQDTVVGTQLLAEYN
jgi:hypothetical protein